MSNYILSNPSLNPNRVFILQKSEMEKRLDPMYYAHEYNQFDKKISKKPFKKFNQILKSINNGYDFRDYKESGTPYLKVANVKRGELDFSKIQYIDFKSSEISKNIQLKKGNLLLTRKGTFGNAFALDKDYDFVISSEVFYLELQDNSINPKFLEIFFNSRIGQAQFDKNKIGAIMGSLSQDAIRDLKIPLPSSDIQNHITEIYENYTYQKQTNEAEAEKLLASIDNYLLTELGITLPTPPENTLKNRMFIANSKDILGSRFDPFYHQKYFENIFCSIHNSKFKVVALKKTISNFIKGVEVGSSEYLSEGIPFVRVADITDFSVNVEDADKKISKEKYEELKEIYKPKQGEILYSKDGTIGFCVVVENEKDYILSSGILRINCISEIYNYFLKYLLSTKLYKKLADKVSIGTVIKHLTIEDWLSLPIPVPPFAKQKEIADHITNIRNQAQALKDQTKDLLKKASEEIEEILLN